VAEIFSPGKMKIHHVFNSAEIEDVVLGDNFFL